MAKVNDIWIMGTENYNITLVESGKYAVHFSRYKTLEKHSNYYLDVQNKRIYMKSDVIRSKLDYGLLYLPEISGYALESCNLRSSLIFVNDTLFNEYMSRDYELYLQNKDKIEAENKRKAEIQIRRDNILQRTKALLEQNNICYEISFREDCPYYNWAIDIQFTYRVDNQNHIFNYVFFIKSKSIDFCRMNSNYPKYNNLETYECEIIMDKHIEDFVYKKMSNCNRLMYTEIRCVECKKRFTFTKGESDFFKTKGFDNPKRCSHCRQKKKRDLNGG